MQKIDNWNQIEASTGEKETLPAGGYICKIMGAKEVTYNRRDGSGSFSRLEISIDIADGPYKDFYAHDYRAQKQWGDDQKWKGVVRPYCPTSGSDEQSRRSQAIFKAYTNAIEASNPGYTWNWDEKTLKGKLVGVMFRDTEWAYNGRTGWKVQPYRFVSVDVIKNGNFETPKPKPLPESQRPRLDTSAADIFDNPAPAGNNGAYQDIPSDDDLPF